MSLNQHATSLRSRAPVVLFLLALIGAGSLFYYYAGLFIPRVRQVRRAGNLGRGYGFGDDFYPIWLTTRASLRQHCDLYSDEMTRAIQTGLFGRPLSSAIATDPEENYRAFAYPAFTDLLFWPTVAVPFPTLRLALAILLAGITAASIFLWLEAMQCHPHWEWVAVTVLLTLASYPVLEGLYAVQLGLLVGFLMAASILALVRGRLLVAGTLMALTTIKPQMSLLAICYVSMWTLHDWRRRGRFLAGFFGTALLLLVASLAVWPYWITSWIRVLMGYHKYAEPILVGEVFGSPLGTTLARPATVAMIGALLIISLVIAWKNRAASAESNEFWFTLALLLGITTVSLLPGQAVHDHVVLLPGIFLLFALRQRLNSNWAMKALLAAGLMVLIWPWLASLVVIVLRPLLNDHQFYTKAVLGLPLRTAGMFPFFVLGLLALGRYRLQAASGTRLSSLYD